MRPKSTRGVRTLLVVSLLLGVAGLAAQDIQIRTRVDLVVVPVTVKDRENELIRGLGAEDFTVLEAGKKQTITNFSADPTPISAALLIDTGLSSVAFSEVRESFPAMAGAFNDPDEVTAYQFDHKIQKLFDFTNDKFLAQTTLQALKDTTRPVTPPIAGGPFSTRVPLINGIPVIPGPEPIARAVPRESKLLHDAIYTAAEELAKRAPDRRKIILVVSDGRNQGSERSFGAAVNRLLEHGIAVYAMGMDDAFLSRGKSTLASYADRTGGDACYIARRDALEACYFRATEQARDQYVLGYFSSNKPPKKGPNARPVFREIQVKAALKNAEILHRKGYFQYP